MLGTILVGALPRWSHSRDWGYLPTGGFGAVPTMVAVWILLGRV